MLMQRAFSSTLPCLLLNHRPPSFIQSVSKHHVAEKSNNKGRVLFRNATIEDIPVLMRWDEEEHIQNVMGDYEFNEWDWEYEIPRSPPWRQQWVAEIRRPLQGSEEELYPIGFVQIINAREEETQYWGEDMEKDVAAVDIWIGERDCIGVGYGTEMMEQVLEFCFKTWKSKAVVVDPMHDNEAAHRFYRKCGMKPVGYRLFGPDKCLIHRIERNKWKES